MGRIYQVKDTKCVILWDRHWKETSETCSRVEKQCDKRSKSPEMIAMGGNVWSRFHLTSQCQAQLVLALCLLESCKALGLPRSKSAHSVGGQPLPREWELRRWGDLNLKSLTVLLCGLASDSNGHAERVLWSGRPSSSASGWLRLRRVPTGKEVVGIQLLFTQGLAEAAVTAGLRARKGGLE